MKIIGAGVGRTGTYSLRMAINRLGFGPCHHMEDVLHNMPVQVPLWSAAVNDHPDWGAIYGGYRSAVDWPTACFYRELAREYPSAKFVLTTRTPASWADSFAETIYKLLAGRDQAPAEMRAWLDMAAGVVAKTGMPAGLDRDGLIEAFISHNESVKEVIPADRLLVFAVQEGWAPLCRFLDAPVPDEAFPRSNDRKEFWELVQNAD